MGGRTRVVCLALTLGWASCALLLSASGAAQARGGNKPQPVSKRMADNKEWTTANLDVPTARSYCYENAEANCRRYGRLYTWEAATRACPSLGSGWRLPTNDEWRQLATRYGGLHEESADTGRAAFDALMTGGRSGFGAVLGGGRDQRGAYARVDAHGFYWTATESTPATAWFYNFGRGASSLNRHRDGEKGRAFAVRCVKD